MVKGPREVTSNSDVVSKKVTEVRLFCGQHSLRSERAWVWWAPPAVDQCVRARPSNAPFLARIEMASLLAVWSWGKDEAFEGLSLAHCLLCWVRIRSWPFFVCLLGLQAPGEGRSGQGSDSFPVAHSQCVPARNVCWTNGWVDMNDGMFEFEWHDITNLCLLSSCWESPSCWARGVFLFVCGSSPIFRTVLLNSREKELPLGFL